MAPAHLMGDDDNNKEGFNLNFTSTSNVDAIGVIPAIPLWFVLLIIALSLFLGVLLIFLSRGVHDS
jgi:hypothetical protein